MPKPPPEVIEDFTITLRHIAKDKVGEVYSAVAKLNLNIEIDTQLVTHVPTFAQRTKTNHDIKSEDFLTAWIKDHPTFKAREAIQHFRADGRTDGAGYTALRMLVENRVLRKLGEGNYTRADVKHLAAPKKSAKPAAAVDRREVNHREFILRVARRNHSRFNTAWMKTQFEKDKRKPGAVSPSIDDLIKQKKLKRVGSGEYVLLAKTSPAKKPVKQNGNGTVTTNETPTMEVTSNG